MKICVLQVAGQSKPVVKASMSKTGRYREVLTPFLSILGPILCALRLALLEVHSRG